MLIVTENHNLGLLQIDHRHASAPMPGVQDLVEVPTYTCTHCESVVVMNPNRVRPRYTCRGCSHMICDSCGSKREAGAPCRTFAQLIDEFLEKQEKQVESSIILP